MFFYIVQCRQGSINCTICVQYTQCFTVTSRQELMPGLEFAKLQNYLIFCIHFFQLFYGKIKRLEKLKHFRTLLKISNREVVHLAVHSSTMLSLFVITVQ